MPDQLLTGDPSDPRFDPPTQEEQDYLREHFVGLVEAALVEPGLEQAA